MWPCSRNFNQMVCLLLDAGSSMNNNCSLQSVVHQQLPGRRFLQPLNSSELLRGTQYFRHQPRSMFMIIRWLRKHTLCACLLLPLPAPSLPLSRQGQAALSTIAAPAAALALHTLHMM